MRMVGMKLLFGHINNKLAKMGPIPAALSKQNSIPKHLSFPQCKQLLNDTIQLLEQNRRQLKMTLHIFAKSFKYSQQNWATSKVICDISNYGIVKEPQIQEITLDLEQIYRMHNLVKHFRKEQEQPDESGQKKMMQPQERITAGGEVSQSQCCICFDSKPTTMLPCLHAYCPLCTSKYIIQKQQHLCPLCRRSFHGNRASIKRSFYEIIEEEKILYEQARSQIIEMVAKYNLPAVRVIQAQEQGGKEPGPKEQQQISKPL